jgi:predicted protein tyrosine phosphatase
MSKSIYVCSILEFDEMKKIVDVEEGLTGYIVLTIRDYSNLHLIHPLLKIKCEDTGKGSSGFITENQIDALYEFINTYWLANRWIVMCDAGMSRSPAVAMALNDYYGQHSITERMKDTYRFYNEEIYKEIVNRFEKLDKRYKI